MNCRPGSRGYEMMSLLYEFQHTTIPNVSAQLQGVIGSYVCGERCGGCSEDVSAMYTRRRRAIRDAQVHLLSTLPRETNETVTATAELLTTNTSTRISPYSLGHLLATVSAGTRRSGRTYKERRYSNPIMICSTHGPTWF